MNVRSLWVIRVSALGDVVLSEPAVAALAAAHPGAHFTFVTSPRYADLYRHHPAVHEVLSPAEARTRPPPDLAVDLQNRLSTRWLARRAARRSHWRKRDAAALWRTLWGRPLHVDYRAGPHQVERIAAALGLPPPAPPRLYLDAAWRAAIHPVPDGRLRVALCPGASRDVKRWPAERFAQVAVALEREGIVTCLVGGPADAAVLDRVAAACGAAVGPLERPLGVVAADLERCDLVLGNDSGLMHVAAAVGVPTVTVFGPTPPGRWAPRGRGVVVSLDPPCGPCSDHGARPCRLPRRSCLDDLPVERVVTATLSSLRDTQKSLRR